MTDYRTRIATADEAVSRLKSGQRVYVHNGCAEPLDLVNALTRRGPGLRDVEVVHMATMGIADYTLPEFEGHFRHNGLFLGANVRRAVQEGRGDYTPIFLSEIEGLFRSGSMPVDLCLLQCSPPDEHGFVSLGVSTDITHAVLSCSRFVAVEINPQMPRTFGDTFLHIDRADVVVESSHQLVQYPQPQVTDV